LSEAHQLIKNSTLKFIEKRGHMQDAGAPLGDIVAIAVLL
jgi:hypothetical protein